MLMIPIGNKHHVSRQLLPALLNILTDHRESDTLCFHSHTMLQQRQGIERRREVGKQCVDRTTWRNAGHIGLVHESETLNLFVGIIWMDDQLWMNYKHWDKQKCVGPFYRRCIDMQSWFTLPSLYVDVSRHRGPKLALNPGLPSYKSCSQTIKSNCRQSRCHVSPPNFSRARLSHRTSHMSNPLTNSCCYTDPADNFRMGQQSGGFKPLTLELQPLAYTTQQNGQVSRLHVQFGA